MPPKKSSGNFLKRSKTKFERVSTTFGLFATKASCRTCENSKSRTEVRDLNS